MNLTGNRDFVFNPTVNCEILSKELKWTTNVLKKRVFRSRHLGVPGSPELCCLGCSVGMRQRVCLFSEVTVAEMTTGLQDICPGVPLPGSSDIKMQEGQGSWQDRFQTCGYPLPRLPIPSKLQVRRLNDDTVIIYGTWSWCFLNTWSILIQRFLWSCSHFPAEAPRCREVKVTNSLGPHNFQRQKLRLECGLAPESTVLDTSSPRLHEATQVLSLLKWATCRLLCLDCSQLKDSLGSCEAWPQLHQKLH